MHIILFVHFSLSCIFVFFCYHKTYSTRHWSLSMRVLCNGNKTNTKDALCTWDASANGAFRFKSSHLLMMEALCAHYDNTMTTWSIPPGKMIKCRSVIAQQITMKTTEQARHTKHIVYTYIYYVCCCINTDWNRLHRVAPCICISSAAVLSLSIWTHRTHGVSFRIDANSHASCPLRRLNIAHNSTQRQAQYAGAYGNCLSFCIFQMLGGPECVCVCF